MPTQSDLRFTFDLIGSKAREVFEVELHEALSVEFTSTNPAVDFDLILDLSPVRQPLWHGDAPVSYVHGAVSSFASLPRAENYS